jgi:CBS domain-containing protein
MRAKELMTPDVEICRLENQLSTVASVMAEKGCGIVPIVRDDGRLAGVITDRDICLALAHRGQRATEVRADQVMTSVVHACSEEDYAGQVLEKMKKHQVRRLPVVDETQQVRGIISLDDLAVHAKEDKERNFDEISYADVVDTFKAICAGEKIGSFAKLAGPPTADLDA